MSLGNNIAITVHKIDRETYLALKNDPESDLGMATHSSDH